MVKAKKEKLDKYLFKRNKECSSHRCGCYEGAFYGLGFIGAAIYYISTATGFWQGVLGVLKAIVWPVFLVQALMKFLGM